MTAKYSHPLFLGVIAFCTALVFVAVHKSDAKIIDSVTQNISHPEANQGNPACQISETISLGKRNEPQVFKHWVNRCGQRAELTMKKTEIGKTYWYGWSIFVPQDWKDTDAGFDIVTQFAAFPTKRNFARNGCGGVGSKMARRGDSLIFDFQYQSNSADIECKKYALAKVSQIKGQWVDFVMNVKWTGNKDGFLKFWMKTGNKPYVQKIGYKGRTFWNDEGAGPYFKMGLYKGDPNFKGPAPRVIYTAEYRLGNANSSFRQVAPRSFKRKIAN